MTTITTRAGKGSPLTNDEVDANFTNLNDDKIEASGDSMTGDLSFGDNDKAIFGAGSDLQIYHDGSNSYITDASTGDLIIDSNGNAIRLKGTNGENMIVADTDASAKLFHNGSEKLATTSTGIDVTGTVTADGLTVETSNEAASPSISLGDYGIGLLSAGTSGYFGQNIGFYAGGTTSVRASINSTDDGASGATGISFSTGNATSTDTRLKLSSNGDISFYEDTGTTAKFFWDASDESLRVPLGLYGNSINSFPSTGYAAIYSTGASGSAPFNEAGHLVLQARSSGALRDIIFATGNGATERLRIDSSGNVGIGESDPSGYFNQANDIVIDSAGNGGITVKSTSVGNGRLVFTDTKSSTAGLNDGGMIHYDHTSDSMRLHANGAERLRLDSSGNVGIGTSSPSEQLHLRNTLGGESGAILIEAFAPNIKFNDLSSPAADFQILVNDSFNVKRDSAGDGTFEATDLTIDSSGNVGIGTSSPASKLHLLGDGDASSKLTVQRTGAATGTAILGFNYVGAFSNNEFRFFSNSTERARLDASGNLLVGKTAAGGTTVGCELRADGRVQGTQDGGIAANFNRLTNDGVVLNIQQDSATIGTLGTNGGEFQIKSNGSGQLSFNRDVNDEVFIYRETTGASNAVLNVVSNVGGTDTTNLTIAADGDVTNTNNSYGAISDAKLKENVTDASPKLDKLNQVRVVNYNLKSNPDKKLLGVVAQELEQVFPAMVNESPDLDADGNDLGTTTKSVKYSVFVPMLIKAMQEQQEQINELKAEVAALKGAN